MSKECLNIQKSIGWCEGTPAFAGLRKRLYFINKNSVVSWPELERVEGGIRPKSAKCTGSFVLKADAKWLYIDIIPDKSQLTSDPQGELPSQTQLNKLTAVHPGVGPDASAAAAYLNNSDNVFLVQDMNDEWRIVGSEKWMTKTTVNQDNGQGAAGTTSTTISVEASDEVPSPYYYGEIVTEDGTINAEETEDEQN